MRNKSKILSLALAAGLAAGNIGALPMNVFAADTEVNVINVSPSSDYNATPIKDKLNGIKDTSKKTILKLEAGTYYEKLTIDKSNVTIVGPSDGAKAVFSGNGIQKKYAKKAADTMITIKASDVTIDNVEITDLWLNSSSDDINPVGIRVENGVSNIRISKCEIDNLGCKYGNSSSEDWNGHGIIVAGYDKDGRSGKGISNVTINDCYLHDLTLGQSETLVLNGNVDGFAVYNNVIENSDNIGIDIIGYEHSQDKYDSARNGEVYNNIVTGISSGSNNAYGFEACAGGIYVDGGQIITIHDNYVENCDIGIELASEHENFTTDSITVKNNILKNNNEVGGISIGGYYAEGKTTGYATNCKITNNTVYNSAETCFNIQRANDPNNEVKYNIFYAANDNETSIYENDKKDKKNKTVNNSNTIENNLVNLKEYPTTENKALDVYDESMTVDINSDTMVATVKSKKYTSEYGAYITWGITPYEPVDEAAAVVEPINEEPAPIDNTTEEANPIDDTTTEEVAPIDATTEEPAPVDPIDDSNNVVGEPSYDIHDDSNFYTIDENDERCKISYYKTKDENWKHVNIDFENVDLSKYSTVKITVKPSRKLNLGITNQDEKNPIFYRNHWNKEGKFTSTKETTLTINLTEDNANGLYLYFDATSNDSKKKDTSFKITDIWFE